MNSSYASLCSAALSIVAPQHLASPIQPGGGVVALQEGLTKACNFSAAGHVSAAGHSVLAYQLPCYPKGSRAQAHAQLLALSARGC